MKLFVQYKVGNDDMLHQSCIFHSRLGKDRSLWQGLSVKAWQYCQMNNLELVGAIAQNSQYRIQYNARQINNYRALQMLF